MGKVRMVVAILMFYCCISKKTKRPDDQNIEHHTHKKNDKQYFNSDGIIVNF